MKKVLLMIFTILLSLNAQALFEVKDASDHSVFEITDDGIRIFNYPDTLMIISSAEIRANLDNSTKGLSRSFSVSTSATGKGTLANVLEVTTGSTYMREGGFGAKYTDFSPDNIFVGLYAGLNTEPSSLPFNAGDPLTHKGKFNIFIGNRSGQANVDGYFNLFVGNEAGQVNASGEKNTFVGSRSGQANADGGYNSFFGYNSGIMSYGLGNTFIGANSGIYNEAGNYNTYLGAASGEYFQGHSNTFLGYYAGNNNWTTQTGSRNVFIGNQVGSASGSVSDKLYIDNSNTNSPLIYGDFLATNRHLKINGENLWINNIEASTTNLTIDGDDGYIKQLRFYEAGAYKAGFGWSGANDYIFLYEGGQNSFASKGGMIGIRNTNPQTYLHVGLAGEVNATEGGGFILGPTASYNLSMDENEIQARNGTGTASLYLNNYGGNVYAGGTFLGSSDLRLKKDIADVSYGLKDVLKMRSVSFNWKNTKNQHKSMGFIAQELELIFPELVFDDEKGMKSVNYDGIIPILVNSIKEQQITIEENKKLKSEIDNLKSEIEQIKKILNK